MGILWGTQNGRLVEIEHAFEAAVKRVEDEGEMVRNEDWAMDLNWVAERIAACESGLWDDGGGDG